MKRRPCIGVVRHDWTDEPDRSRFNGAYWVHTPSPLKKCRRCGDPFKREPRTYRSYFVGIDCWCTFEITCADCIESLLRMKAIDEQEPIIARLRSEEEEVASLYGLFDNWMRSIGTPTKWIGEYPEWQLARTQRMEATRQRRALREGAATMRAIRKALRHGVVPSPPQASKPAKTSRV